VLPAVNLDDQPLLAADKIANVRADRLLPDEFASGDLPIAKMPPQLLLGVGLI
jgi:hypothetical protein